MARPLTEQKVLDRLNIPDWRHITKDKVIELATMLPKMDPEVAKTALEQFPEFAKTAGSIVKDYKEIFQHVLEDSSSGNDAVYRMYDQMIQNLDDMLKHDDLDYTQKIEIMYQMREIADATAKFNKEDKQFRATIFALATFGVLAVTGVVASALGVDVSFPKLADQTKQLLK